MRKGFPVPWGRFDPNVCKGRGCSGECRWCWPYEGTIGDRLKHIRLQKHLTLRQAEELTGVSFKNIFVIEERKNTNVSYATAAKLADGLGVPLRWLMEGVTDHGKI